jgi:PAS domain S-box-containing protein
MEPNYNLLEALPVAVYIVDAEGRITFHNSAAVELWGRAPTPEDRWCASTRVYASDGSPMALETSPICRAVRTGEPVRGVEAILERPDGTRIPYAPHPTAIRDERGSIVGAINMVVDLTDRQRGHEQSNQLAAIVSSSDDAIISKTLDGRITSWNAGAERIFGYKADEMVGRSILTIIPEELRDEEKQIIAQLSRGERIDHFETVRVDKGGRRIDLSITVSPVRDPSGRVVGASKVARDISDRKRAEETQKLLVDELHHRIKNTLATVQAIASQTLRRSPSPSDFVTTFNGRLQALARAHSLLTSNTFQGAELTQVVRDQLLLGGAEDNRISYAGPTLFLEAQAALHLALVLHELGTNARKHGALSNAAGAVSVRWEMPADAERKLLLTWRENGGPKVVAPTSRGFGTTLIEQSLEAHGGEVSVRYAEEGVTCSITLPLGEYRTDFDEAPVLAPHRAPSSTSRLKDKRILIVEDEALIAMVLMDYLADAGALVIGPAHNFDSARALIDEGAFDAALLDANLSGRRVDALALALTQKQIPFAFVTGYGRDALPQAFQGAVAVDKPFTGDQIRGALEQLLRPDLKVVPLKHKKS